MFNKLKSKVFKNKWFVRMLSITACFAVMVTGFVCSAFAGSAEAVSEPSYAEAAQEVFSQVHSVINFNNILAIIGVALTAEATLFMLWWGIRKVIKLVRSGLNGKLKA